MVIRPEIDGRLIELHFQEGQAVAKGAKLVTFDPSEMKRKLAGSRRGEDRKQRLERTKELLDQKFISQDA